VTTHATDAGFKIPESVLVVIHTPALEVLLLERADHPGFWQSVTGSRASLAEPLVATCAREVEEETGHVAPVAAFIDWQLENRYRIYPQWRHRYAPGVTENTEHVFGLTVPLPFTPRLSPREHGAWRWLPWREAADACFSWTNASAVRTLPQRVRVP
jgi:dATP pyrophosphohydrolase